MIGSSEPAASIQHRSIYTIPSTNLCSPIEVKHILFSLLRPSMKHDYLAYIDYVKSLDALLLLFRHVHNSCSMKCSHELGVHFYCGYASRSTYCTYSSAASFFLKFPAGLVVPEYIHLRWFIIVCISSVHHSF
ncbi:unnamed protein product [Lactuca virosa]|uniref:Uncharacterized protein n=1 Tax=Lactuca virosa TaxID=75947 RepID=A0AAU9PET4_9ASTR|nr:unnamed protein product [Lactuca virosa]